MSTTKQPAGDAAPPASQRLVGGIDNLRPVTDEDLKIWDLYKEQLEKKIQDEFQVPKTYKLQPVQVATQVVAGQNYFFKVELPDKKYATARVYHVPWQAATHGQADHVALHPKLASSVEENVGHF